MNPLPFYQIDAFTDRPLGGNPCAILLDTDGMDEATMQAVAQEMNLSETAFVRQSDTATFGVRYFTPAEEIPMAGHPTLATVFALITAGRLPVTGGSTKITLEMKAGIIPVEILSENGIVSQIIMTQNAPQFFERFTPAEVMPHFGLTPDDALPGAPIQIVSTGTPQLIVPIKNFASLKRARLNFSNYAGFRRSAKFFSPHLFCVQGITPAGQTFARHFGMPPDTLEDPFTGSATGGMAAYLWYHGLIDSPKFIAEQGHWMNRPGQAFVEVIGPRENIESVKVGGQAALIVQGEIMLDI